MTALRSLIMAFSMFTKIPMPRIDWDARAMRYLLCAFPLVGLTVGAAALGWSWVVARAHLGGVAASIGYAVLPIIITGGIHMDGFCDVTDALSSYGDREKKLAILKDPHIGAFALMGAAVHGLMVVGAYSELVAWPRLPYALMGVFALSRTLSGGLLLTLPGARPDGLGHAFSSGAHRRRTLGCLIGWAALVLAAGGALWPAATALVAAALCAWTLIFIWRARHQFGGMTGDLAGYYVQIAELVMLAALLAAYKWGVLA